MNFLSRIFSTNYLFSVNEKFKYWYIYLPFFGILVVLAFAVNLFLKKSDDYIAKKSFARQFFWVYLSWGVIGLAFLFARAQYLPTFGSRFFLFLVIFFFILSNIWLVIYYQKYTKKAQLKLADKKRKEKWLKKR